MPHPELASEQAYVDNAYACLDKMRATLEGSQDRMATEFAAVAMEAWLKRRRRTFQDAERGLCFGRLTLDGTLRPLYIGRRWVHDDAHEALVVNWQAPAARPLYRAAPERARPRSASTARRGCCLRTASSSGASSSSDRTRRSWTTSRTSCRRWARRRSSSAPSPRCSTGSESSARIRPTSPRSKPTRG